MGSQKPAGYPAGTEVCFSINGKKYTLSDDVLASTTLNVFIREYANLRGTKVMCREGGCGACLVAVTRKDPTTKEETTIAVNSCLMAVYSCNGLDITTIEGLGSKKVGYSVIQKRLADMNGSQCGYCSPGMVMNMHCLMKEKRVTMKEVENSFGGNICRCTGYRPILDAFKSLALDASPELLRGQKDIEDLDKVTCPRTGEPCLGVCESGMEANPPDAKWYKVTTVWEIFKIFGENPRKTYMLIAGNTAQGVYRITTEPQMYIDVSSVKELTNYSLDRTLCLGANMSLTNAMATFKKVAGQKKEFAYLKVLADHIDLIASVPVRNIGTIAGNLFTKHNHHEFPSDMFLMLETVGATLDISSGPNSRQTVDLISFLSMDMHKKVIEKVNLKQYDGSFRLMTYKIMPRAQNAHAFVNAGFLFKLDKSNRVELQPRIVFGGINETFVHAEKTEKFLIGKQLFTNAVLQGALEILDSELKPDYVLPDAVPAYRKGLAKALFYKFVLSIAPDGVKKFYSSGGDILTRPLSSGRQDFETNPTLWPLNQPIPKLEATVQCAGEAKYVNDELTLPDELFAAFVLTRVSQGTIANIDPGPALAVPGVEAFYGAKDIPGTNSFVRPLFNMDNDEEIFCSGKILFAGQPVGIVVAKTQALAKKASTLVKIDYKDVKAPILTIDDAIKSGDTSRVVTEVKREPTRTDDGKNVAKGKFSIGSQYHFTMEPQTCLCIPVEDGLDVYPTTQWVDLVQQSLSVCLALPETAFNLKVRRLGGGYGGKISRNTQVVAACALAALKLNKPVRFAMELEPNMEAIGKRFDGLSDYEVGFDNKGTIQNLKAYIYQNSGSNWNETVLTGYTFEQILNCYDYSAWYLEGRSVRTDVPSNTYMRAPGSLEGLAYIEVIMEHIAQTLKMDPMEVRFNNFAKDDDSMPKIVNDFRESTNFDQRKKEIDNYNKSNRWKKRGISIVPMKFPFVYLPKFSALVSIYGGDGTVSVSHGGIECGQGVNTKVAQVCARFLGVPLEMVIVKPTNSLISPNNMMTGSSVTSESCAYSVMVCCQELIKRLEPIKKSLNNPNWQELIAEAYKQHVDLCATYMFTGKEVQIYSIYGVSVSEVEVDILTGQLLVRRVDIMEDAGQSMSPEVDIGQVEGAFVMGIGLWTSEEIIFDPKTGELLTNRTWNYKPPGAKDIPADFRVKLRPRAPNATGVLRSKSTGEPPLCMSISVFFAIKNAVQSAREDAGDKDLWFPMNAPATAPNVFLQCLTDHKQFLIN